MLSAWVSIDTGEILGTLEDVIPTSSAEWMTDLPDMPEAGDAELVDRYLEEMQEYDAEEAKLKAIKSALDRQHQIRLRLVNAKRSNLRWRKLSDVQAQVAIDVASQRGDAKSVHYTHGTAGTRMTQRIDVTDEKAARYYCLANHPEAVKHTYTLLKSQIPKDAEVPGILRVKEDAFFARPA